jgi:hypothetical protein
MTVYERKAKLYALGAALGMPRERVQEWLDGGLTRDRVRVLLRDGASRELIRQALPQAKPNKSTPAAIRPMSSAALTPYDLFQQDRGGVDITPEDEAETPEEYHAVSLRQRESRLAAKDDARKPRDGYAAKRARAMDEMYQLGATFQEVGTAFGVTRERVRQILNEAELGTRSGERAVAIKARRRREHMAAVLEAFRRSSDARQVARELELPYGLVKEIVCEHVPTGERRAHWKKPKPKYSDEELIEFLRIASRTLGGVLTTAAYTSFASARETSDGRNWPTHQTHSNRFGSWRLALEAAGLAANPASAIAGQTLFQVEHCVDAVRSVSRGLGKVPTAAEYDVAARDSRGALPSLATVRNRCGTWNDALSKAGI